MSRPRATEGDWISQTMQDGDAEVSALLAAVMEEMDALSPRDGPNSVYERYLADAGGVSLPWRGHGRDGLVDFLCTRERPDLMLFIRAEGLLPDATVNALEHSARPSRCPGAEASCVIA